MNVTRKRIATNGLRKSFIALSQARESSPVAGFGGVCGSVRLNAASANDARAAARKTYRWASNAASPCFEVPRAVPSQSINPPVGFCATAAQSTRMKMNGQEAAIHPIVPHTRTGPNFLAGSRRLANAIELVIEMVGT